MLRGSIFLGTIRRLGFLFLSTMTCVPHEVISANLVYKRVEAEDFFLDRKSLIGKLVEIHSKFMSSGDIVFIVLGADLNATYVVIDRLDRSSRKLLMDKCSQGCQGVVRGKVIVVPGDIGIRADNFAVDD